MFGSRLDEFAVAGFNNEPMPSNPDDIELRAYEIGRKKAGLRAVTINEECSIEKRPQESWKVLGIVGV